MAIPDPTDRDQALALSIPPAHKLFLLDTFKTVRRGINEDLADPAGEVRDPAKLRSEAAAFAALIEALEWDRAEPDPLQREVLAMLAASIDEENEYELAVFEHHALYGLLRQLQPPPQEPVPPRRLLATNIARLRKQVGFSQQALGLAASIHPTWISHLESGRVNTNLRTMERLAEALRVDVAVLLMGESN